MKNLRPKASVLFCSFSFSPVHYEHIEALVAGLHNEKIDSHLLLNERYRTVSNTDHNHVYMTRGKRNYQLIWDVICFLLFDWMRAVSVLRETLPSMVFFQTTSPLNILFILLVRVLAPRAGVCVFMHEPASLHHKRKKGDRWAWTIAVCVTQWIEARLADYIIFGSRNALSSAKWLRIEHQQTRVAKLLLLHARRPPQSVLRNVILYVGRIAVSRGIKEFLELAALSRGQRLPFHFVIVSSDPFEVKETNLVEGSNLEVRCGAALSEAEIAAYFQRAIAVYVHYSVDIMQSGVPPMAYKFGCGLLASDTLGLREDVIEGKTGYFLPVPWNAHNALALVTKLQINANVIRSLSLSKFDTEHSPKAFRLYYSWLLEEVVRRSSAG